jgi:hypothetical protein
LIDRFEGMLSRLKVDGKRIALRRLQGLVIEPLGIGKRSWEIKARTR